MRIAIPRFGESVAPCFEYSATMAIFDVEEGRLVCQADFPLQSRVPYDRVRLMKAEKIDTVICGGLQSFYEDLLKAHDIQVISWVSGNVEDLLKRFLEGRLAPGTAGSATCLEQQPGTAPVSDTVADGLFLRRQAEGTNS